MRRMTVQDGNRILYVSNALIDKLAVEHADNPTDAWRERCYGGETPDAKMVEWITLNVVTPAPSADLENQTTPTFGC